MVATLGSLFQRYIQQRWNLQLNIRVIMLGHFHQRGNIIVYNLFDKRDTFPFSTVCMPHIDSNSPQNIFYSAIKGEFLRISCSTLCLNDFIAKTKELLKCMQIQSSKGNKTNASLWNTCPTLKQLPHFEITFAPLWNKLCPTLK